MEPFRQGFMLSPPMNSRRRAHDTSCTDSGNCLRNCRICRATSSLRIVSPRRCVPHKYSRVSSRKHSTGRRPALPRCFVLWPLRAPDRPVHRGHGRIDIHRHPSRRICAQRPYPRPHGRPQAQQRGRLHNPQRGQIPPEDTDAGNCER